MISQQTTFDGGMNLILPDTQIPENGYVMLINGRQRFGYVEPNYKHRELSNSPAGKKQNITALGNILIVFVAGKAYYQVDGTSVWIQVPGFLMSTSVDRYYTQVVPASTMNFIRKSTANGFNAPIVLSLDFNVSGTPACLVVQDTINQPWLIFQDETNNILTARVSKTYAQWANTSATANDREYVPIGRQMMFINQALHIVSPDRKSVYRSVTGRPLDFVVAVDVNGNKLADENQGGAKATSYAFDFNDITCLQAINIPDSFVYGTARNVRMISLDYTNRIFGEPTFTQSAIIDSGIVNQDSFAEMLGDYVFIDFENVKSFNAVQQLHVEGRNSIFSLQLSSVLNNIKQRTPACTAFNNYLLCYLKTNIGNLIAVYDILRQTWVSFDLTVVDQIKQFAIVETVTQSKLYCITSLDEVYQLYDSTQARECAYLFTRAIANVDFSVEHKSQVVHPIFKSGTSDGVVGIVEYIDGHLGNRISGQLLSASTGVAYPVQPPVIPSILTQIDNTTWLLKDGRGGHKISYIIYWNTNAQLKGYIALTTDIPKDTSLQQTNSTYATNS